jgi:beta-galactosidase
LEAVRPVKDGDPESVPAWETVTLPHSYNASDAVDPDVHYYQDLHGTKIRWTFKIRIKNGRVLLHFEGAGQKTEVYIIPPKSGRM